MCVFLAQASELTAALAFTPEVISSRSPPDVVVRVGALGDSGTPGCTEGWAACAILPSLDFARQTECKGPPPKSGGFLIRRSVI